MHWTLLIGLILWLEATPSRAKTVDEESRDARIALQTLDPAVDPEAWLNAFLTVVDNNRVDPLQARIDEAIALAQTRQLIDLQIYLMLVKAANMEATATSATVLGYYSEMRNLAEKSTDPEQVGRIAAEAGRYCYSINLIPEGIRIVQFALERMEQKQVTDTLIYNMLKQTQALMLLATDEPEKAIRTWKETYDWAVRKNQKTAIANSAYNIANTMIQIHSKEYQLIESYFDQSQKAAEEIEDVDSIGSALYGKGKLALEQQQYDKAMALFDQARPVFFRSPNPDFAGMCLVFKAQALFAQHRYEAARQTLDQADHELKDEVEFGKMLILDLRARIAEQEKDFEKAFRVQQKYWKAWQGQKEEEERKQLQKLSASMGLQLEEERNKTLQKEAERFRIYLMIMGGLAGLILLLLILTLKQSRRVALSQKKMQQTLDNIDEGLLTIDSRQTIGTDYSKHLLTLLGPGAEPAGSDLVDRVFRNSDLSAEKTSMIREVLQASFHETDVGWSMNEHLLPRETVLDQKKSLAIRWVPIFNNQQLLSHVLVSLHDVTEQKQLKEQLQTLPQLVREMRRSNPALYRPVLLQAERIIATLATSEAVVTPDLRVQLHTVKGNARMLGFSLLSEPLHDLESTLREQNLERRAQMLETLRILLEEYKEWTIALHDEAADKPQGRYLVDSLRQHLDVWMKQLTDAGLACREITVVDGVLHWPAELLQDVSGIIMHAVNNSLEHGFIFPHQRGVSVASPAIHIEGQRWGTLVRLEIRDNGSGLDWVKLQKLAAERRFVPGPNETVAHIVFDDGISTADRLTISSGRGVGLAAIKSFCVARHGRLGIQDNDRQPGTLLWLEFYAELSQAA